MAGVDTVVWVPGAGAGAGTGTGIGIGFGFICIVPGTEERRLTTEPDKGLGAPMLMAACTGKATAVIRILI